MTTPQAGIFCPQCSTQHRGDLEAIQASCTERFHCQRCGTDSPYQPADIAHGKVLRCFCGRTEFYRQKDFSKAWGMGIAVVAFAASFVLWGLRYGFAAFAVLFGLLFADALLYRLTGSLVVCYACSAFFRGLTADEAADFDHDAGHETAPVKHLAPQSGGGEKNSENS